MSNQVKKTLSLNEWIGLFLGMAFILGAIVRFFPGLIAGFPLNDGGMFLSMVRDLSDSRYILPEFTTYNGYWIPFAYPPFGFYLARFLSDFLKVPELELLRWIPPLVNSFSILAFYLLASELLRSRMLGALASAFYALTPGAFGWFIMGGGLTRGFGSLFLLLTLYPAVRFFCNEEKRYASWTILFGSLTVLSHPEAGIHAASVCVLIWFFGGRSIRSFLSACWIGMSVFLLTSPWWGTLLVYHGWTPFFSALHTGSYGTPFWVAFPKFLAGDGILPLLLLLRMFGLAWGIWRRQFFLVAWVLLPYLVEPRSAPSIALYPMTMLTILAFSDGFLYGLVRFQKLKISLNDLYKNRIHTLSILLILIALFVDSGLYGFRLVGNSLKTSDLQVMDWVALNTPVDASILSLTGIVSPEIDPFIEWLPALTGRNSPATIQGLEWTLGERFFHRYTELARLQSCESEECIFNWSQETGLSFDYVIIRDTEMQKNLFLSLAASQNFRHVHENGDIVIFQRLVNK